MIWNVVRWCFLCALPLIFLDGTAQTGFYLTYPCKDESPDIITIDRSKKNVCVTANPIVAASDLQSLSRPISIGNDLYFDIHLTEKGYKKLQQVYSVSALILFKVQNRAVFLMDTEKDRLAGTIRVYITGKDTALLHGLLAEEIENLAEQ